MNKVNYNKATIQRFDKGVPSTVIVVDGVVGNSNETVLKNAMRQKKLKDTKTTKWRLVSVELIKQL